MPRKKAISVSENGKSPPARDGKNEIISAPSFFDVDYNEMDRDLSPDQQKEWTAIYASFRSRTPLTGTVIGVDGYRLAVTDPVTKAVA